MKSSYNLPHTETFSASGELNQSSNVERLMKHTWDVIVIVAGKGDPGPTVSVLRFYFPLSLFYFQFFTLFL